MASDVPNGIYIGWVSTERRRDRAEKLLTELLGRDFAIVVKERKSNQFNFYAISLNKEVSKRYVIAMEVIVERTF